MKKTKLFLTMVAMMSAVSITGCSAKVTIENQETAGTPTITVESNKNENQGMNSQKTDTNVQNTAVAEKQPVTENQPIVQEQTATENQFVVQEQTATENQPLVQEQTMAENQPAIDKKLYEDVFVNGAEDWNYVMQENEEFAYNFELLHDEATYQEYATITCMGDKGTYWEYKTGKYEVAQSAMVELVGVTPYCLYVNEGGTITALNIADGKILWQNSEYQGSGSICTFDNNDNLYVAAYAGPALMIIDPNGNTLCKVEQFADYMWPYEMYFEDDNMLTIHFDSVDNAKITMDIRDYSYTIN